MADSTIQLGLFKHLLCPKEAQGETCTHFNCMFRHKADDTDDTAMSGRDQTFDGAAETPTTRGINDDDSYKASPPVKRRRGISDNFSEQTPTVSQYGTASDVSLETGDSTKTSDLYDPFSPPTAVTGTSLNTPVSPPLLKHKRPNLVNQTGEFQPSTPVKKSYSTTSGHTSMVKTSLREALPLEQLPELTSKQSAQPSPRKRNSDSPATPVADQASSSPATSSSLPQNTTSVQKAKAYRKPESLNPRSLKSAPATHGVRHKLLQLLHAEFTRLNSAVKTSKTVSHRELVMSDTQLIWMALDHEQHVAMHKGAIYTNVMKQNVMTHKKMTLDAWTTARLAKRQEEKKAMDNLVSPEKKPVNGPPIDIVTGLTPDQEYAILHRLYTPIKNLAPYGYVPEPPPDADIAKAKEAAEVGGGSEQCDRCHTHFQVFPGRNNTEGDNLGKLASHGKCTYHPKRPYFPGKKKGETHFIPGRYGCCEQDEGVTIGCAVAPHHVFKISDPKRLASLWNFVRTPPNDKPLAGKHRAVCFDCEMGYTVYGMEVIRVTATSWPDGAPLLDVLVQPFGEIIDLNSTFSGVLPEDLANAAVWTPDWTPPPQEPGKRRILQKVTSPKIARDLLFSLITPDTPLIGHSLENDLNVLRIIHPVIVDTVLLYPNPRGLPRRMGLKVLMAQQLNRVIQVDSGQGHDSAEDARAAGDLVRWKLKTQWDLMQSEGWKLVDGIIRGPGWKPPGLLTVEILEQQALEPNVPAETIGAGL